MTKVEPRRAPVRPRVVVCDGGVPRLFEEEIAELLQRGEPATVFLRGGPGSGKSTALAHLAALFGDDPRLALADGGALPERATRPATVAVVARGDAAGVSPAERGIEQWRLASWCEDDCLEYLRRVHPERIAAAWRAFGASDATHDLLAWPGLCTRVLDVLARDDAPADALQALAVVVAETDVRADGWLRRSALRYYLKRLPSAPREGDQRLTRDEHELLRSHSVRGLLAAQRLLELARWPRWLALDAMTWDTELATAIVMHLQQDPARAAALHARVRGDGDPRLPLALLGLATPGYRPEPEVLEHLAGTPLAAIDLRDKTLRGDCRRVFLPRANLDGTTLVVCDLTDATVRAATARAASWRGVLGLGLQAQRLVADGIDASGGQFARASFADASLARARLDRAVLRHAKLTGASLRRASLRGAVLVRCDLRRTNLAGASLLGASLVHVDAADTRWVRLDARAADFAGADLTGSTWPRANLRRARLRRCYLAAIAWPGADLRGADLRGATFHRGNSRSGLVPSDVPGEGSRTGFYTDESKEQHFRAPEQIRVADLRGADLRGARLDDVDLYLVDLRGARLDPPQLAHARRCRALLDAPAG